MVLRLLSCLPLFAFLCTPPAAAQTPLPRVSGPGDVNWDTRFGPPPGGAGLNGDVTSILVLPNGDLLAFGAFTDAGGHPDADHVARWDGTAWHPLGTGLPLPGFNAIQAPNGDLIAGLDGTGGIHRWDGTSWQPLGGGLNSTVIAVAATPSGDIYAGSNVGFTSVNGNSLVRWDGTSWLPLSPTRFNQVVLALAPLPNGDLIVGGQLNNLYGNPDMDGVARWDGTTWHSLGSGIRGIVWKILPLPNGDLLIGGDLFDAGGNPAADGLARWDGTAWHSVGGFQGIVFDLALAPNGDLLVAGDFRNVGGVPGTNRVARWDGTAWHALGTGVNQLAVAVAVAPNGDVAVGGGFTVCGDSSLSMSKFGIYRANPLGIASGAPTASRAAWPNPATTTVQVPQPTPAAPLTLTDALGRVVRRQAAANDQPTITLDVADLPRGLYWMQAGAGPGQRLVLE